MLSNAYFLAKFRFDTAENKPAKNLQNFADFPNFADPNPLTAAALRLSDTETLKVEHFWQRPCDCQTQDAESRAFFQAAFRLSDPQLAGSHTGRYHFSALAMKFLHAFASGVFPAPAASYTWSARLK